VGNFQGIDFVTTSSATTRKTAAPAISNLLIPKGVLLIEDDPLCGEMLTDLLQHEIATTFPIYRAPSLAAARAMLKPGLNCDLVLLDHFLPDGQGLELVEELRRALPNAAVIMLTGHGGEALAVRAFQSGVRDYLNKVDLSPERLADSVQRALQAVGQQVHAAHTTAELLRVKGELDHFLRAISHDMGANLMLMESTVDVLKHETAPVAPPTTNEGFQHLEACLRQSNRFIHDLVNLAKTGSVEMEPTRVNVVEVANQVLFEQRRLFAERQIEATVIEPIADLFVHPARLKQVLTNLVRNAARHGCDPQQPRITISARTAPTAETNNDWVWIAVTDNGPGIPAAAREEIFLPGKRLPTAHAEGSGMGLAIVKKIVDHYGGQVLVDPRCETGTAMIYSLPRFHQGA
jgi:signal transduction histidine kinase